MPASSFLPTNTCFAGLPSDVLKDNLSKLLNGRDACRFQSSCKAVHDSLDLAAVNKNALLNPLKERYAWRDCDNDLHLWTTLDFRFPHKIHSVSFTCRYKDQGWGNRKSSISIAEIDEGNKQIQKVLCSSPTAEHHSMDLTLEFHHDPQKRYALFYKVGGGGGHELFAENPSIQTLIHGSVDAKLSNADLPFQNDFVRSMILTVVRMMSENDVAMRSGNDDGNVRVRDDVIQQHFSTFATLFRESLGLDLSNLDQVEQISAFLHNYEHQPTTSPDSDDSDYDD